MNKPSKIALALAIAAATASGAVSAQTGEVNNWQNPFGDVWRNGTGELCWRTPFWTPATGIPGCDGVPVEEEVAVVEPVATKVVLNADTFFDRSEEHTSELQSRGHLVCRLLLEKKKKFTHK